MDLRENIQDHEEVLRAVITGLMKNYYHVMPAQVTADSTDGHVASVQPTIKRIVTDPDTGAVSYEDHPVHVDVPIHHLGGGGISTTHPTKADDTGAVLYASRAIDTWFQSNGSQQPVDDRMHSPADGLFLSGVRSIPKMLKQVSQTSSQTRTDDKRSVIDHGPNGTHIKSVDPSTGAASSSFDPFTQATKFFDHLIHPTNGHAANATDGSTTHSVTNDHTNGPKLSAANGSHTVNAHPENGVSIASTVAHTIAAPNANLDASGNLQNSGTHTAQGSITSTGGNISAPAGSISGASGSFGSLGGLGGAALSLIKAVSGIFSSVSATGAIQTTGAVQGATLQTTAAFTVATLPAPSVALQGMRSYVTDASAPVFMSPLTGGGSKVCPAFCDGTNWMAA